MFRYIFGKNMLKLKKKGKRMEKIWKNFFDKILLFNYLSGEIIKNINPFMKSSMVEV